MEIKLPAGFQPLGFVFVDHMIPKGLLPNEPGAHACWYYCRCAMQLVMSVDEGQTLEGEKDLDINQLNNIAQAIAAQYSLRVPDEFLLFMDFCKAEAMRLGWTWDERIEKPSNYKFIRVAN